MRGPLRGEMGWRRFEDEVLRADDAFRGEDERALHRVLELANVAEERVPYEDAQRFARESWRAAARVARSKGRFLEEARRERGDLARSFAERGDDDADPVEPIVEVEAEV